VILQVEDGGRGIAAVDLPRITEPFFTTRYQEGGTGLGLAIAAKIVRQYRGDMEVQSNRGHGTTVTVSFASGPRAKDSRVRGPRKTDPKERAPCVEAACSEPGG